VLWGWLRCVRSAPAAQEGRGVHGCDEGHETVFLPQGRVPSVVCQPIVAAACVTAAPHGAPVDLRTVDLRDQAVRAQPVEHAIERARREGDIPDAARDDLLHEGVAVERPVAEGDQDVERHGGQRRRRRGAVRLGVV